MQQINPFQPVGRIVEEMSRQPDPQARLALTRSVVFAIHQKDAKAVLMLALAFCVWLDARLDAETMEEVAGVLRTQGAATMAKDG